MNTDSTIHFIEKTIKKTNCGELSWNTLPNNFTIKFLPGESSLDTTHFFDSYAFSRENSYVANYRTGQLLLLVRTPKISDLPITPPDNCILSLRIQDDKSKYSVEIAVSMSSNEIATMLIRLYNLIDKDVSSLNNLIQDFLNS